MTPTHCPVCHASAWAGILISGRVGEYRCDVCLSRVGRYSQRLLDTDELEDVDTQIEYERLTEMSVG